MKRIIILLGPPGAGKGTVGSRMAVSQDMPLISSGDLLREGVKNETPLGMQAKGYMDRGELVPDDLVIALIEERIGRQDCDKGFILDGFPRTLNQARMLEKAYSGTPNLKVIYLKAGDDFLIKRLSDRRVCLSCGKVYHLVNLPPEEDGLCDKCTEPLVQRKDDKPEVIRRRLEVYHSLTAPLLAHYESENLLYEIPGDGELQNTLKLINNIVNE